MNYKVWLNIIILNSKIMIEIRLHGRGGQGTVAAAELIAIAAFQEGKESQAFPSFGVERRGAPVEAYARIADNKIRLRSQVYEPDFIIVQDPTLISVIDVFKGLKKNGGIIINSEKKNWPQIKNKNLHVVPVTKLAIEILGRPITNTGLLAAFAKVTGLIEFEALVEAVKQRFAHKGQSVVDKNIELMRKVVELL